MMEAVILAGELGTRLRSVVLDLPKRCADRRALFPYMAARRAGSRQVLRVVLSLVYKSELVTE